MTLLTSLLVAGTACAAASCPDRGDAPITLASVEPRLELRLVDGRRLRLVGMEAAAQTPDDPDLPERTRSALAAEAMGRALTARILSEKTDRWGRMPALVFRADMPMAGGLAALAIARGLGRYSPEAAAHECREALLAAETAARTGALGLWHDPYYGVLAVDDRVAFTERSATTVVAEGRLWRVDAGPFRTKLRFAAPHGSRRDLLVAVVPPKVARQFGERGVHFEALTGTTMRFRGLLDLRFGPQVDIAGPDAVEILPPAPAQAAAP